MKKTLNVWSCLNEYKIEKRDILTAVNQAFSSGKLILGDNVKKFEEEFSSVMNCRFGIGVNSGTDALFLSLKGLGIGPGMEVITVPNTAIPTASAIVATGATPVFVDINPDTYLMETSNIEEKITQRTKCILPVHLYGQCCDMDAISKIAKKHHLYVLEDCAQSTGSKWKGRPAGSMSDVGTFSFYPTKVLGAYGDGGMIITNSSKLATKIKMLRMYGISKDYYSEFPGYNSRLDEVQAAILLTKLKKLNSYIEKRQKIAKRYYDLLKDTPLKLPLNPNGGHVYYLFVCSYKNRDKIIDYLKSQNILLNISYRYPLHTMKGFRHLGYKKGDFPQTEKASSEIFSIPIYPELNKEDQDRVINSLKSFFNQ